MQIHIDKGVCKGNGVCEGIRPDIFEVGQDGLVDLIASEVSEQDRKELEDAVAQCPTGAIRLTD